MCVIHNPVHESGQDELATLVPHDAHCSGCVGMLLIHHVLVGLHLLHLGHQHVVLLHDELLQDRQESPRGDSVHAGALYENFVTKSDVPKTDILFCF